LATLMRVCDAIRADLAKGMEAVSCGPLIIAEFSASYPVSKVTNDRNTKDS
jgi:hypothetical protein